MYRESMLMILSHWHWDHTGDPALFPRSTKTGGWSRVQGELSACIPGESGIED